MNLITPELIEKLGLKVERDGVYTKKVTIEYGFYECIIYVTKNKFLSINATNDVKEYKIVYMMYVPDTDFFVSVLSRLMHLRYIFPEIIFVPEDY